MPSPASNRTWFWAVYRLIFCGLLLGLPSMGMSETKPGDYLIKTWDSEDSLSGSTVTSIIQTPDGYLWVGTYEGLTRFDGNSGRSYLIPKTRRNWATAVSRAFIWMRAARFGSIRIAAA